MSIPRNLVALLATATAAALVATAGLVATNRMTADHDAQLRTTSVQTARPAPGPAPAP